MSLVDFLSILNVNESAMGVWVNADNPMEDYLVGYPDDVLEGWVYLGSLWELSFAQQSRRKGLESFLGFHPALSRINDKLEVSFYGKDVILSVCGIFYEWCCGNLDPKFNRWLDEQIDRECDNRAYHCADYFVQDFFSNIPGHT